MIASMEDSVRVSPKMKTTCWIIASLWILFAYFQVNDAIQYQNHDHWFWILYYLMAAGITFWAATRKVPTAVMTGLIGFSFGAALFRLQDQAGNFDFGAPFRATAIPEKMTTATQIPNEVGGLIVVGLWLTGLMVWQSRRPNVPS